MPTSPGTWPAATTQSGDGWRISSSSRRSACDRGGRRRPGFERGPAARPPGRPAAPAPVTPDPPVGRSLRHGPARSGRRLDRTASAPRGYRALIDGEGVPLVATVATARPPVTPPTPTRCCRSSSPQVLGSPLRVLTPEEGARFDVRGRPRRRVAARVPPRGRHRRRVDRGGRRRRRARRREDLLRDRQRLPHP